ncbi:MAG: hypothetical protein QOI01_5250 [Mycobacterium sp.]|jgi:hypothetical protein|nr:hypothetical protein [Mycobacterium sp.]
MVTELPVFIAPRLGTGCDGGTALFIANAPEQLAARDQGIQALNARLDGLRPSSVRMRERVGGAPSARGSDLDARQAPVDRRETGLRAIVDAQLGVDTLDVVARRLLCDVQLGGDFTVRPALRD